MIYYHIFFLKQIQNYSRVSEKNNKNTIICVKVKAIIKDVIFVLKKS